MSFQAYRARMLSRDPGLPVESGMHIHPPGVPQCSMLDKRSRARKSSAPHPSASVSTRPICGQPQEVQQRAAPPAPVSSAFEKLPSLAEPQRCSGWVSFKDAVSRNGKAVVPGSHIMVKSGQSLAAQAAMKERDANGSQRLDWLNQTSHEVTERAHVASRHASLIFTSPKPQAASSLSGTGSTRSSFADQDSLVDLQSGASTTPVDILYLDPVPASSQSVKFVGERSLQNKRCVSEGFLCSPCKTSRERAPSRPNGPVLKIRTCPFAFQRDHLGSTTGGTVATSPRMHKCNSSVASPSSEPAKLSPRSLSKSAIERNVFLKDRRVTDHESTIPLHDKHDCPDLLYQPEHASHIMVESRSAVSKLGKAAGFTRGAGKHGNLRVPGVADDHAKGGAWNGNLKGMHSEFLKCHAPEVSRSIQTVSGLNVKHRVGQPHSFQFRCRQLRRISLTAMETAHDQEVPILQCQTSNCMRTALSETDQSSRPEASPQRRRLCSLVNVQREAADSMQGQRSALDFLSSEPGIVSPRCSCLESMVSRGTFSCSSVSSSEDEELLDHPSVLFESEQAASDLRDPCPNWHLPVQSAGDKSIQSMVSCRVGNPGKYDSSGKSDIFDSLGFSDKGRLQPSSSLHICSELSDDDRAMLRHNNQGLAGDNGAGSQTSLSACNDRHFFTTADGMSLCNSPVVSSPALTDGVVLHRSFLETEASKEPGMLDQADLKKLADSTGRGSGPSSTCFEGSKFHRQSDLVGQKAEGYLEQCNYKGLKLCEVDFDLEQDGSAAALNVSCSGQCWESKQTDKIAEDILNGNSEPKTCTPRAPPLPAESPQTRRHFSRSRVLAACRAVNAPEAKDLAVIGLS